MNIFLPALLSNGFGDKVIEPSSIMSQTLLPAVSFIYILKNVWVCPSNYSAKASIIQTLEISWTSQMLKTKRGRNYMTTFNLFLTVKKLAKASFGLKTDHWERGERIINKGLKHFQNLDIWINISKTLREKWVEMVNNSFLSLIRET